MQEQLRNKTILNLVSKLSPSLFEKLDWTRKVIHQSRSWVLIRVGQVALALPLTQSKTFDNKLKLSAISSLTPNLQSPKLES